MPDTSRAAMLSILERQRRDYIDNGEVSAALRIDRLDRAIALLVDHQQRLVEALTADFGHRSRHQSLFTDIAASIGPLKHAKKHVAEWMKPEKRKVDFPLNLLGVFAGIKLDKWLHTSPLLACVLPLLILAGIFYKLMKETAKPPKDE